MFGYSVDVYERIRMPEGRLALSYFAIPFRVTEKLSVMSPVTLKFNQEVFDAANEYWEFLFDDYCSTVTQQNKLSEIDLEEAATNALNEIRKNNTTIISIDAVSMAAPESVSHYSISHGKWVVSNLKTHSVN